MTNPQLAAQAQAQPVLQVTGLQVRYGELQALHGLDLVMAPGERVALVGGSGSGKTSAARALAGLLPRAQWSAQQLVVGGRPLHDADERAWRMVRGRLVGMAFQDTTATLDPLQRIGTALDELLLLHRNLGRGQGGTLQQLRARLLESVELHEEPSLLQAYPHQLSGGQRQRVGLALALAGQPALLIADEPTSALDPRLSRAVARLLLRLSQSTPDHGSAEGPPPAILLISHDFRLVQAVAQRALVLDGGRVVEQGPLAEMVRAPQHETTRTLMKHAGLQEGPPPPVAQEPVR